MFLLKHGTDRLPAVNTLDGFTQQGGYGQDGNFIYFLLTGDRNSIGNNHFFDRTCGYPLYRGPREDRVGGAGIYLPCPLLYQGTDRVDQRAGGVYFIIDGKSYFTLYFPDNIKGLCLVIVAQSSFFHNGQRGIKSGGEVSGALGNTDIGSHDHQVIKSFLLKVIAQKIEGGQLINGDVEEALNLCGMQVDGQ